MRRRPSVRHRIADLLDLPRDLVLDLPRISIVGDVQVLVQNHRGVVGYDSESVVIGMEKGRLVIRGDELTLGSIHADEAVVTGRIASIEFLR